MDAVIEFVVTLVQTTLLLIVDCIKAILPVGFLRRKNVEGSIVLITGSGSGLGRMMAVEFAKLGCRLVLWDVNTKGNEETKAMVEKLGAHAHAYTVNLAKKEDINAVAAKVKEEVGNVDILINNAGIVTGRKIFDCPDELMELTMAVNTNALFFTAKNFIPSMLENNHGHFVTVASMAGKIGAAGLVDYCASKHGAVGFHESLTSEISAQGKTGVKTTVVCPYYIDTGMFEGVQTKFPTLLPIMKPEFVIENIMEAILTDKVFLALPKFCYVVLAVGGFLPTSVSMKLSNYFGINETMDHFTGRSGKKAN